jgi:hypothetical protein
MNTKTGKRVAPVMTLGKVRQKRSKQGCFAVFDPLPEEVGLLYEDEFPSCLEGLVLLWK